MLFCVIFINKDIMKKKILEKLTQIENQFEKNNEIINRLNKKLK